MVSIASLFRTPLASSNPSYVSSSEELQIIAISATAPLLALCGLLFCAGIVTAFWDNAPNWTLCLWATAVALATLPVPFLVHNFEQREHSQTETLHIRKLVIIFASLRGLVWGLGPAYLTQFATEAQLLLLIVVVFGSAMGAGTALITIPLASTLFTLGALIPLSLACLTHPNPHYAVAGGLMLVFAMALRSGARSVGTFIAHEAQLRQDLVAHQNEILQAKIDAEAANRTKSEFLAHMSHELRTPLNAIMGFSELIAHQVLGPVGTPQYKDYAKDIHSGGEHLLQLINDILDISKVEAGALELDVGTFSLVDTFKVVERLVIQRASNKSLRLNWNASPFATFIRSDERLIKQILINLVTNAIKFTPNKGSVSISSGRAMNGNVYIRVEDSGVGMSEEGIAVARKPFGQVSGNSMTRTEGTGLGLPLCDRFARVLGGELQIESAIGRGTCVSLRLPPSVLIQADLQTVAQA